MSHVSRIVTVDRVFANPALMHRAERETLTHLHNLNLGSADEDFQDVDAEFDELEVVDESEVFMEFEDYLDFDPIFD